MRSTKILGVVLHADKSQPNLVGLLKTQIAIYSRFISPTKTLKAKQNIIETFILPKLFYHARHTDSTMKSVEMMQNLINSLLKAGRKMEIISEVLYQSSARVGISLPYIILKIVSEKFFDEKFFWREPDHLFKKAIHIN